MESLFYHTSLFTRVVAYFLLMSSLTCMAVDDENYRELASLLQTTPLHKTQLKKESSPFKIQKFLNSCHVSKDLLSLKSHIKSGYLTVKPCGEKKRLSSLDHLNHSMTNIQKHTLTNESNDSENKIRELNKEAEFHALTQAGIARIKTLRILRNIDLNERDLGIEVKLLCHASYGKKSCSSDTINKIKKELAKHLNVLNESISLGLEKTYSVKSANSELTKRMSSINESWKSAYKTAQKKGAHSPESQLAYSKYLEKYSLAVSDPIGVMLFNSPFNQIPKSMDELGNEKMIIHSYRSRKNDPIRIRDSDIKKGFEKAISQSMRHVENVSKCRQSDHSYNKQTQCLLETAPTAIGHAIALNPSLANSNLCSAIQDVNERFIKKERNIGHVRSVTKFLNIVSVPLLVAGGGGFVIKGISSIMNRLAASSATRALTTSSRKLTLASLSNNLLSISGNLGIAASAGRFSGGSYSAAMYGSDYLNHTAAIQAAAVESAPEELERAIKLRSQMINSFRDLKEGAFDFLPFGSFLHLAKSNKIAKLVDHTRSRKKRLSQFEMIARGQARLNRTLQLIQNNPRSQKAFQTVMKTSELGSSAVTNMIAAMAKMNFKTRLRILNHIEKIKDRDSAVISFFKKISEKFSCF